MLLLPMSIAKVSALADKKDSTRFALSGVHLKIQNGRWFAESTDSKRLIRVSGELSTKAIKEYPPHSGMDKAEHDPDIKECLIPAASWNRAFTMMKPRKTSSKPALNNVALKFTKTEATFGATDLDSYPVENTRLLEGRFPTTDDIVKQTEKSVSLAFAVDPKLLADSLNAMAAMMGDGDKRCVVYCDAKGEKPVILRAKGATGEEIELLMMPLAPCNDPKKPVPVSVTQEKGRSKLRKHVTEKIEQGEAEAIEEVPAEPLPKLDEDQRREPDLDPHACVTCREVDCVCQAPPEDDVCFECGQDECVCEVDDEPPPAPVAEDTDLEEPTDVDPRTVKTIPIVFA